jgi:hypothetical protein
VVEGVAVGEGDLLAGGHPEQAGQEALAALLDGDRAGRGGLLEADQVDQDR